MDRADVADNPEPIPMVPLGQDRPTSGSAEGANVVEPTPRIPPAEASQRSTAAHTADSAAAVEQTPSIPQGQAGQGSPTVKEPEPKYVLSGQPTGWAAMSKEVREFDEEKIQNSKDDVDTLLVFAGLFSAILSAFLVAAYPNLQPSPMAIMNYNLERIATQTVSYNFTDGKLISTTIPPISPPPFLVSDEDIRVNVLWFASLVLSLMTASFGMLVKQWLREFLAVENPSPQARLRIRHFRAPQLKTWMVFEIVACLPLLLQLSLGLFFVGLCYFTASIHQSVGHTTLPLVVGWALCFFGATSLPIFFPRCPYRTTLLKAAIACFHRWLYHVAEQTTLSGYVRKLCSFQSYVRKLCSFQLAASWQRLIGRATELWEDVREDPAVYCLLLVLSPVLLVANLLVYISKLFTSTLHISKLLISKLLTSTLLTSTLHIALAQALRGLKHADERVLVEDPKSDVEILASVDAIQGNDELLGTTIAEALRYSRPQGVQVCKFLSQVLSHRGFTLPQSEEAIPRWLFHQIILSEMLRPQACESIIRILNDHTGTIGSYHQPGPPHPSGDLGLRDTSLLFCVIWLINLSAKLEANPQRPTIDPLITSCLQRGLERMDINPSGCQDLMACITPKNSWANAASLLRTLSGGLQVTRDRIDFDRGASYFASIWSDVLTTAKGYQHDFSWSSRDIPDDDDNIKRAWNAGFPQASVKYLCALLSSELMSFPHDFSDTASEFEQVLCFAILVCNFYLVPPRVAQLSQEQVRELTAPLVHIILLAMNCRNQWYIDALLSLCEENMDSEDYNPFYFCRLPVQEGIQPSVSFMEIDLLAFSSLMTGHLQSHPDPLYVLGLCQTAILFLLLVHARTAGVKDCQDVFIRIANTIQSHGSLTADRELTKRIERIARQCLEIMEDEADWQQIETIFPDEFISVFGNFIDPDLRQRPDCPRRLQELLQRQRQNVSSYASQSAQGIGPSQMSQSPPAAAQAVEEMGDESEKETETSDVGRRNTGPSGGGGESSAVGALEDIDATNKEDVSPSEAVGSASIGEGGVRDVTGGGGTDEEPGR